MTDKVHIEIDGKKIMAEQGSMIIEAADDHNVYIPRFCYHKKLSVAANCRMCLIEVEGGRKAMPACATPITEGMKVKTRSELARKAQKAVMEFLLINHPLDCPICDQGGQCELQDLAMGYGNDISEYDFTKRVVKDKNLGPLIATDMTRCIHCTRCVRFGKEIVGEPEMGTLGRGEHTEIGTYIERAVRSELSGNIIDVCPVGALTSKPFRFSARAWELQQRPSIAAHDCLGSNINVHSHSDRVKRVVPKEQNEINEVWLSDRDRFAYEGVNSDERVTKPLLKKNGKWQEIDWTTALEIVASSFENVKSTYGAEQIAALISASSTVEEQFLLQKLMRQFGSPNIDHRVRQTDFSDEASLAAFPKLNLAISELENLDAALLIGSDVQREQPLLIARLLKAFRAGGEIMPANVYDINGHFMSPKRLIANPENLLVELAGVAKALATNKTLSPETEKLLANIIISDKAQQVAAALSKGQSSAVILGAIAQNSEYASIYRYLGHLIAELSGSTFGVLSQGANSAGAWLTGCVPHRGLAGSAVKHGENAQQMLTSAKKAYLLFNIEPEFDSANPATALKNIRQADFVVACSPFVTETMRDYADVILPIVPYTETAGTFINCNAKWQSFDAVVNPLGEARPGWKVLRVLGNFLDLSGFDYSDSAEIRDEVKQAVNNLEEFDSASYVPAELPHRDGLQRIGVWPLYRIDNIVRRSEPLQQTLQASEFGVRINEVMAQQLNLKEGEEVSVCQADICVSLPVIIDNRGANDCVYIAAGVCGSEELGSVTGPVVINKKA
jgi:NADH-quinone oxidoreductase subunit G